jgi:CotH kinase protein
MKDSALTRDVLTALIALTLVACSVSGHAAPPSAASGRNLDAQVPFDASASVEDAGLDAGGRRTGMDAAGGGSGQLRRMSDASKPDASKPGANAGAGDDTDAGAAAAPDAPLFATDKVLDVDLTLADADWQRIRNEGRSLNEVFSYCLDPKFSYSVAPATARVNGVALSQVGLRKKGYMGSLSAIKPALHLEISEYTSAQRLFGTKTLVLNNSLQDRSFTHTCMAFEVFASAGLAAPRCAFARVHVNGDDMGVYVEVEPIKKPFLAQHFGRDDGDLYEGGTGLTDFRSDMLANFEKKTNEDTPLAGQVTQLAAILARSDDNILAEIDTLVDMDEFMRFWATETLIADWDGYTGDLNNFYLYVHPVSHKLVFIPWGTDAAFEHNHAYLPEQGRPQSVYAWARLPRRLYAIEQSRERFRQTLRSLLEQQWNETTLLAEVDRIAALLGSAADPDALEAQRQFIRGRRTELLQELDATAPTWPFDERPLAVCHAERNTPVSGAFHTTWDTLSAPSASADDALDVTLDGTHSTYRGGAGAAGPSGGQVMLEVIAPLAGGRLVGARFTLAALPSAPGEVQLLGFETYGAVVRGTSDTQYTFDGFVGSGKLIFDQVGTTAGAAIVGRFEGQLVTVEPALAAQYGRP